jgi:hypothetical protein
MSLARLALVLALILISCASPGSVEMRGSASGSVAEIRYLSLDHTRAFVFSGHTARGGSIEAYAVPPSNQPTPPSPMRTFRTADNVQCISVGPPGNTIEFAVRRPIRAGDRYRCLGSSFEVSHCTEACRSAIIRVERSREPDIGPYRSQIYVDSCRGVLIISDTGDLAEAVPLDARLLRDPVGILADPSYPTCNWF